MAAWQPVPRQPGGYRRVIGVGDETVQLTDIEVDAMARGAEEWSTFLGRKRDEAVAAGDEERAAELRAHIRAARRIVRFLRSGEFYDEPSLAAWRDEERRRMRDADRGVVLRIRSRTRTVTPANWTEDGEPLATVTAAGSESAQ